MNTVKGLIDHKGSHVWSVTPDDTVLDAIRLMAEKGIGAVLVLDKTTLVGIMSERDYARQVILKGRASRNTPVRDIMTSNVVSISPKDRIEDCLALMTDRRIRHLPVMEDRRVVGIVSIGDLVRMIIDEQRSTIEQLTAYVTS